MNPTEEQVLPEIETEEAPEAREAEEHDEPAPSLEAVRTEDESGFDLTSAEFYLNRELTWLSFNWRVLNEAEDERNPLLERVKFLAIVNSNLDEFVMKRIGGLKQQVGAGVHERTIDGRTPREQISESLQIVRQIEERCKALLHELTDEMRQSGIFLAKVADLDVEEQALLRAHYVENIYPLVTPQAMDPAHPFPFVSNLSLNLLVTLCHPKDQDPMLARVKVPVGTGTPRLIQLRSDPVFVTLEDLMAHNLDLLFPGMDVQSCEMFRVTRNAIAESDEGEQDDLLSMIESELRERKFAPIVRLQVNRGMAAAHRGMLAAELGLDENADVVEVDGMLGLSALMGLASLDIPHLRDEPHRPVDAPELVHDESIFHCIREHGSILLQHPYQLFSSSVERFVKEASEDPKVRAIKLTLYRTSEDTQIIDALIEAARNGKQVAVVLELKARFDESANIRWASRMEKAGIHVTYGVVGLKTHCKVILAIRQDYDGLRRYAHLGTGNYHAGTARIYSDVGMLTCDDQIGEDLTELFNYLTTGYKPKRHYKKLLPAPTLLKAAILEKIEREIENAQAGKEAKIIAKMNALEDSDATRALYEASQAGVEISLIVRDTCRLRPGIPGLSENVRVVSIVGRFLEHARIAYFHNDGDPEYYIGSADWMKRNLESRVECMTPVEKPEHRQELDSYLTMQLEDDRNAWVMQPDGSYLQGPGKEKGSQQQMIRRAEKAHKQALRLRKRRPAAPRRDAAP